MWPLTIACGRCQAWVWPWRTGVPGLPPPSAAPAAEPCAVHGRGRELRGVKTADSQVVGFVRSIEPPSAVSWLDAQTRSPASACQASSEL